MRGEPAIHGIVRRPVHLRPRHLSSARIALYAAAAAILGACSGPPPGDPPPPVPSAAAVAATQIASAASSDFHHRKLTWLETETGKGEVITDRHIPELWIPDVEVEGLVVHRGSVYWSDASSVHERPFDGEARTTLPGVHAARLAADEDGVVFAVVTGPRHFEVQQISADARAPRRLARMACQPVQLAPARSFVVVASDCGIFAVPRQGGAPRLLERETHLDTSLAADRDHVCHVNDHRLTCRSLADSKAKPMVLDALRPGPLLLDRWVLYALEEGRLSDVPIEGDYGRLVRWDISTGERRVLTNKQFEAHALLHDDKAIYYGTGAGSVRRVAKNGSRVQTLHNEDREGSPHIAIGGDHVYFVAPGERGIRRFRLAVE